MCLCMCACTTKDKHSNIYSLVSSVVTCFILLVDDCMMSENDPGVLIAPPSATLPSTDL